MAFNNYLMIGMAPLMLLGNILTMVSRAEASAGRFWEVLDTRPAVKVAAEPHTAAALQGQVTFEGVSFHYDGSGGRPGAEEAATAAKHRGGRNVLEGITVHVEPGQRVALLGATGSGKSTLVNLIPRFYDVNQGTIRIDGVDVRDWEPESLRKRIGVVLQQTTLFSGTIRENIAYGRPDASLDEVMAAAQAAQAHDFILAMPQGYDSLVEERGANLSGGQKQRIAIARALLDLARHPDSRRQHQRRGYGDRGQDPGGAGPPDGGQDHLYDRPAHQQRADRRPDPGAGPRADRGPGHAPGAAGKQPDLPGDLPVADGQRTGGGIMSQQQKEAPRVRLGSGGGRAHTGETLATHAPPSAACLPYARPYRAQLVACGRPGDRQHLCQPGRADPAGPGHRPVYRRG